MVGGEGHTVPERVGPRGADNATNPELVCLPCAQLVAQLGGAPNQKKNSLEAFEYLTQPSLSQSMHNM